MGDIFKFSQTSSTLLEARILFRSKPFGTVCSAVFCYAINIYNFYLTMTTCRTHRRTDGRKALLCCCNISTPSPRFTWPCHPSPRSTGSQRCAVVLDPDDILFFSSSVANFFFAPVRSVYAPHSAFGCKNGKYAFLFAFRLCMQSCVLAPRCWSARGCSCSEGMYVSFPRVFPFFVRAIHHSILIYFSVIPGSWNVCVVQ